MKLSSVLEQSDIHFAPWPLSKWGQLKIAKVFANKRRPTQKKGSDDSYDASFSLKSDQLVKYDGIRWYFIFNDLHNSLEWT